MEPPRQVSAHARLFLSTLGRETHEFRCFHDDEARKAKAPPQRFLGTFKDHMGRLRALNETGYGIFVQVNTSDGKGNKATNIVAAPSFFVDLDGAPRENIERLGLEPHCVTLTSPGKFHAYWRVDGVPVDQFKRIQQRLAALMESDKSVCDLPRVMRLPGFLHQKDPTAPFLVTPETLADHPPFSFVEFTAALVGAETSRGIGKSSESKHSRAQAKTGSAEELARVQSALQFLVEHELINLGEYHDWFRAAAALKHTFSEEGWQLFHELSAAAAGYEDEADCRRQWDVISDPSEGPPITVASLIAEAKQAGWRPPASKSSNGNGQGSDGRNKVAATGRFGRGHDPAAASIELAEEAGDEFWLDQYDKPHVSYRVTLPSGETVMRHAPIGGATYAGVLRRRYYEGAGTKTLHKEAVTNATALFEYKAEESGLRFKSSLRVAEHQGRIYVDLNQQDGSVVEVGPDKWSIVTNPPVRFVRGSRSALPAPERGGTLDDFQRHFNLSPRDVVRVVAFMVGIFNMAGSYPILFISGEQGTSKSVLADMIVALTDPPQGMKSARFKFTRDEKDLHVAAKGSRVLCFDNISNITAQEADALCRMATGAASSSRKLYTDDEESRLVVVRPVIATSIGLPSSRADLLSRSILVRTLQLKVRKTENFLMREFERDRPKLLGFLLDCVSAALRNRDAVEAAVERGDIRLPRMGDFGHFVEGASELLGLKRGEFTGLIESEQNDLQADAAQTHTVGSALSAYFSRPNAEPIVGPAREVLAILRAISPEERTWPAANKLRNELTRIAPGLRKLGIEFQAGEPGGRDHVISFRIWATPSFQPARPSFQPAEPSRQDDDSVQDDGRVPF